ncbi:MAG: signal peptidase II [Rhodospirillales bacterium RIFCSPLOWO2_12_FULL_58_28]|nr:MAG: signal peptidase II [Rhodospirillales bacterium RIFCSPLOWO2_02_FULL_58_16]OHC78724.1 MAG: signal peptidase II [Rhodospirillales bacterium RIFCSPLOWO2_12_FULL_58_28]
MKSSVTLSIGLAVAALVIMIDQVSKWWIVFNVMRPSPYAIPVTSFFNIVMTWNRGVSFGMFDSASSLNNVILPILAAVIVGVLLAWLRRAASYRVTIAIGMIIGGAVGNIIDRIHFGAVADFLDFHIAGYHWPAFNAADSGITVGAVILIVDSLFDREKSNNIKEGAETNDGRDKQ